jgi:hypothetical protein
VNRQVVPDIYLDACKVLGIVPVSRISNQAGEANLILRYYGLGPLGAEAFSKALEVRSLVPGADSLTMCRAHPPSPPTTTPHGNPPTHPKVSQTWQHVDFTGNWIEAGGAHIFQRLAANRTLTHLDLSNNQLGSAGIAHLSTLLPTSRLTHLLLGGNRLSDPDVNAIATGLKGNNTLLCLDLSNNAIGDIGAIALGTILANNNALATLNLGWNCIRAKGVAGFLTAIRDAPGLAELSLEGCGIADAGSSVGAWLSKCSNIQSLNIA